MREMRREDDGGVDLFDDADHDNQRPTHVEPVAVDFIPSGAVCVCGAALQPWSLRCIADGTAELHCGRCHRVVGRLHLGTRTYLR
jgi:hypothetical protein